MPPAPVEALELEPESRTHWRDLHLIVYLVVRAALVVAAGRHRPLPTPSWPDSP